MIKREILVGITLAVAALAAYSFHSQNAYVEQNVGNLDMTCGFTADFASFISKNST